MHHAIRARQALLTSLGLLPLSCGASTDTAADGELAAGNAALAECGASAPLASDSREASLLRIGSPPQLRYVDPGLSSCESGVIHRPAPVTCESVLPRPLPAAVDAGDASTTQLELLYPGYTRPDNPGSECSADAECSAKPYGYCAPTYRNAGPYDLVATCVYGCVVDADCGAGSVCECGDPVGRCIAADCASDDECGGLLCAAWNGVNGCGEVLEHGFACQTAADECSTSADCARGGSCVVEGGVRRCQPGPDFICGRPFLVQGAARIATLVAGADWTSGDLCAIAPHDSEERRRVGEHWARAGLMEHASIAAFARFALQLLHLGAPRELLEASQRAMRDETEHARLCFAIAERYLGEPVGAGPLRMDGALLELDFERIVALCFREGCVGETVAALEAREARDHATDPEVQHALDRIAPDEERHAELAWQFIRWALRESPALTRALLAQELRALADELSLPAPRAAVDPGAPARGVLAESARSNIRRAALRDVVLPCAEALLGATRSPRGAVARFDSSSA